MPLFASQLPQHTGESEYWRWRRNKAHAAEDVGIIRGSALLNLLRMQRVWRIARAHVGEIAFAKLDAHCRRAYPTTEYWPGFWRRVLTGVRIEFSWQPVPNRAPGQPAVICDDWYCCRHLDDADFFTLFPYHDTPPDAPPDGGLAELLTLAFAKKTFLATESP